MTQDISQPEGGDHDADEQKPVVAPEIQALIDAITADPARTATEIKALRAEAKQRREQADAEKSKRQQEELARLEADQKWQEVAAQQKRQLDELAPLAQRVEETNQFLKDMVERRVEQLPPQYRALVPENDDPRKVLLWLDNAATALKLPAAPKTGAGEQGDASAQPVKLTPEQEALIARMPGMTREKYIKSMNL